MPSNQLHAQETHAEVLAQVAGLTRSPSLAEKVIALDKCRDLYQSVQRSPQGFSLESLLQAMRVELAVDAADMARIPAKGPVVVVANHPFGMLDGAVLAVLLRRVRSDVKVMTSFPLATVPELARQCIFVDPMSRDHARSEKAPIDRLAEMEALAWLQEGGVLGLFPSGETPQWRFSPGQIAERVWNADAIGLIRQSNAAVLPIYLCGRNHASLHFFGNVHPRLRTAFRLQEFLQQEGRVVDVRVGGEIRPESLNSSPDDQEAIEYLRWRAYLLARRKHPQKSWSLAVRSNISRRVQEPVATAGPTDDLAEEMNNLPGDRCLIENAELAVYLAKANEAPCMLEELGRLREITFRAAGEGTGKKRDLDRFDAYYWHVLLWHKGKQELVGAYRAGDTQKILAELGVSGLYTSTLFRFDERIFEKIGPAIELGRSFVRPEYQRQYAPLLLLWKGIARLLAAHVCSPVLFGAVSISNDYSQTSREMIFRFFEARMRKDELAGMVEPRRPFRPAFLRPWDCRAMCAALRDIEDLSQPITDVETDGKGLPILLRQYAKIGGKLLGFNVDRKFSNVLDGLVVVDLRETEPAVLERYMGREAATEFRRRHASFY
jgi:putative hemolysin